MYTKRFQRRIEDFTCNNCGYNVKGSGYTNHCPKCLWSQHVDNYPGDRAASCGGMMKPINIDKSGSQLDILHLCVACGKEQKNKSSKDDNFEKILALSSPQ